MKSLLFIPAKEKMLQKIGTFGADVYIIDLEDSIGSEDKENALERAKRLLSDAASKERIVVRLNADRAEMELSELACFRKIGFMLPKFESPLQYDSLKDQLCSHFVIALVETPMGIVNIREIAACEWVDAIAFGAEDYTAKANMQNEEQYLVYPKGCVVAYAKAYGKMAFDTPSFKLNDRELFEAEVRNSVAMGFDGKLSISPKHIAYINEQFGICDIDLLRRIVCQYESSSEAVMVLDGKVYEKMHIDRMKRIIKENGGM